MPVGAIAYRPAIALFMDTLQQPATDPSALHIVEAVALETKPAINPQLLGQKSFVGDRFQLLALVSPPSSTLHSNVEVFLSMPGTLETALTRSNHEPSSLGCCLSRCNCTLSANFGGF